MRNFHVYGEGQGSITTLSLTLICKSWKTHPEIFLKFQFSGRDTDPFLENSSIKILWMTVFKKHRALCHHPKFVEYFLSTKFFGWVFQKSVSLVPLYSEIGDWMSFPWIGLGHAAWIMARKPNQDQQNFENLGPIRTGRSRDPAVRGSLLVIIMALVQNLIIFTKYFTCVIDEWFKLFLCIAQSSYQTGNDFWNGKTHTKEIFGISPMAEHRMTTSLVPSPVSLSTEILNLEISKIKIFATWQWQSALLSQDSPPPTHYSASRF